MNRVEPGAIDATRSSLRTRRLPGFELAARIFLAASATLAGFGFILILIGMGMLLDLFE